MEKHIYNEHTGISYTLQGDYYLPDLALPEQEDKPIGLWGKRYLKYIKQHRKILYINLMTSGKLNGYLADIDKQAEDTFFRLVKQMEVLMLNEEFLTEALTGENKKKFLDFVNAWSIVNGESNLDSFIMGFRLGANFTYDTFVSTEAPFKDLLKE